MEQKYLLELRGCSSYGGSSNRKLLMRIYQKIFTVSEESFGLRRSSRNRKSSYRESTVFREMELFSPKIKTFLILSSLSPQNFSLKKFRIIFPKKNCCEKKNEKKTPLLKSFLYFRKWEFLVTNLKKFILFQKGTYKPPNKKSASKKFPVFCNVFLIFTQGSTITIKSPQVITCVFQIFDAHVVSGQIPKSIYQVLYLLPNDFPNNFSKARIIQIE